MSYPLTFSFETKATKKYTEIVAKRASKAAKNVLPTPFSIDYDEVEKAVLIFIGDDNPYRATKSSIKNRKYTAVSNAFAALTPILSRGAMLIAFYIMNNIDFNSNIININEKEFCAFSGLKHTAYSDALTELLRPELDYRCAGDDVKLLARTTRQGIFIVNHNFIFKGSIEVFYNILNDKYPNGCKLDSKGKVIIER